MYNVFHTVIQTLRTKNRPLLFLDSNVHCQTVRLIKRKKKLKVNFIKSPGNVSSTQRYNGAFIGIIPLPHYRIF